MLPLVLEIQSSIAFVIQRALVAKTISALLKPRSQSSHESITSPLDLIGNDSEFQVATFRFAVTRLAVTIGALHEKNAMMNATVHHQINIAATKTVSNLI